VRAWLLGSGGWIPSNTRETMCVLVRDGEHALLVPPRHVTALADAVARLLDEWAETSERELFVEPYDQRCRALLAAGHGLPAAAMKCPSQEGVDEPGVFPVAPDLVEALMLVDEREPAAAVAARLRALGKRRPHPWAALSARRCDALAGLADGAALAEAADGYERLGLRFDRSRTLLALGRAERRRRRWGAARTALGEAATGFDELGSPGWAELARAELGRTGTTRPRRAGTLTATQRRIAELVAAGRSNAEIAQALGITVHTVEGQLTDAYARLGVRSRVQLARRLQTVEVFQD
jgi:DNA-binding CsgD family transcriptional regulator